MSGWFKPIRTQQPHASPVAIFAINLLWFSKLFQVFVTVNALAFTAKRFTDDTRLIALVTSIEFGISFLIGPICNYLSDRIWTRLGRRRPFIVIGWGAIGIAMALVPMMPTYGALVTLIVGYTLIGDIATPLEPLCMEVVPPAQRARSMSVRMIMVQACALLYFQVLFPRFDDHLQIPAAIPLIGGLGFTGEQLIYAIASFLFFSMVLFLLVFVREEKVPSAPNIALRDLRFSPVKSTWAFLVDTFGDRRWWWIYLLYCSANSFLATWSNNPLYTVMLTDLFEYSKASVAIIGLPSQLIGVFMILPVMGWYGDKYPRISYALLLAIGTCAFGAVAWLAFFQLKLPIHVLPGTGWLLVLGGLMMVGMSALYIAAVQAVLTRMGKAGARAWIFLASLALQILHSGCAWLVIRHFQNTTGAAPPLLLWFLFEQLRLALKSCTEVVTQPMFFDFVPRDKMGTLSSGFGFTNGLLMFLLTNLTGAWIQWNSGIGPKNYASGYVLQIIVGIVAFTGASMFLRAFRQGKIAEYGRLGLESRETQTAQPAK